MKFGCNWRKISRKSKCRKTPRVHTTGKEVSVAFAESSSMVVRTLLYGASITMLMLMIPFVNSLGMETIRQGEELDYGIGRGMGSVAAREMTRTN